MADMHLSSMMGAQGGESSSRSTNPQIGDVFYNGTLGRIEIYTSNGWMATSSPAKTPSSVSASNSPTNRAFNNGSATVTVTPSTLGGLPTLYTATSSPGGYVGTTDVPPITVTGLQSNTAYTFSVVASNDYGTAGAINTSSITATTVPQAPTIGIPVNITESSISIPFTANATGGSPITEYVMTSSPDNISATGSSSPITVTGLTVDTTYTFSAQAVNANGISASSSPTGSIIARLLPPPTVEYLVVGSGASGQGGGNVLTSTSYAVANATNYTLTVGGGGGSASVFAGVTSNGGSGGTSGSGKTAGGGGGCNGGSFGGGGGGAGANGNSGFCEGGYTSVGGSGGAGLSSTITGSTEWFGGGGGGAAYNPYNGHLPHRAGGGGIGGGGSGCGGFQNSCNGSNGGTNTGGGGGNGATGGSGIVKIAYQNEYKLLTVSSGLVHTIDTATRPGYRIYTFTGGTGTVNF